MKILTVIDSFLDSCTKEKCQWNPLICKKSSNMAHVYKLGNFKLEKLMKINEKFHYSNPYFQ